MKAAVLCPGPSLTTTWTEPHQYDLVVGVNRACQHTECAYVVAMDKETVAELAPLGNPTVVTTLQSHELARSKAKLLNIADVKNWFRQSGTFHFSATNAVITAAYLGATDIDVYGADMHGTADFDGIELERFRRSDARWQRERSLFGRIVTLLAQRGVTVTRVLPMRPEATRTEIVSYYTHSYAGIARDHLLASLSRLGILAHVDELPDADTWQRGTFAKASVIRDAYVALWPKSVLWLDADACVHRDPRPYFDHLTPQYDVSAFWHHNAYCSGTLWFAGGREHVRQLLDDWVAACDAVESGYSGSDQDVLTSIIDDRVVIDALPLAYIWIDDIFRRSYGPLPDDAIFVSHHQASRATDKSRSPSRLKPIPPHDPISDMLSGR